MKTIAVIPVYNESESIADVVRETRKYCDDVVVVDDCSSDKTAEILRGLNITIATHHINKGQGAATRTGIFTALSLGADVIVTLDGDGQHDPSQIPLLLTAIADKDTDIVIGSRFSPQHPTSIPAYRKFGASVITWVFNVGHKQKLSDSLLCFRAFKRSVLTSITIEEDGFGHCPELLLKAIHKGFKIVEIPANCFYHKDYKRNSTFSPVKLASILIWKIIQWRIRIEL